MTEDVMVEWHHGLNGHEFEQALGDGEGQGSLAYCCPLSHKDSDTTERLNNNKEHLVNFLVPCFRFSHVFVKKYLLFGCSRS